MALSQGMDLIVNIKALYGGGNAFTQAVQSMTKLKTNTEALQKTAGKIEGFTAQQNALQDSKKKFQELTAQYQTGNAALENAREKQRAIGEEYAASQSRLKELSSEMLRAGGAYQLQADKVSELKKKLQEEKSSGKKSTGLQEQYAQEQAKLKKLREENTRAKKSFKEQERAAKSLQAAHKAAGDEVSLLESGQKKLNAQIEKTSAKISEEGAKLSELEKGFASSGIKILEAQRNQEKLTQAIQRSEQAQAKFNAVRKNLSYASIEDKIIKPGLKTYAALQPLLKLSGDFEAAMARVKAVSFADDDADISQFEALKAQAAQLGADTQFTAVQAANAMENLARAGMSFESIRDTMTPLLNMAAAEGMGIDQAASILSSVQSGMGMSASESARIADVLAYTSSKSKTSIATLGEAFKLIAPTAKDLGISIEEVSSYLGVLGNKGFEASVAGNALSSSFLRLSKRPKETRDELNKLGVAIVTRSGQMRKLPDIMNAIDEAFAKNKMGDAERLASLGRIFGGNYASQMSALLSGRQEQAKLLTGINTQATGRSEKMASINLDTLNGQLTILSSAWDGFRTQIGDIFAPIMRTGVEALSTALSKISATMKDFPVLSKGVVLALGTIASYKTISGIAAIAKSFIALPGAFLEVVNAGRNVSSVLASVGASAGNAGGLIATLTSGAKMAFSGLVAPLTIAFTAIKTAALTSLNMIMAHPIIMGTAAVLAGIILLAKNWDKVKAAMIAACDYAREKWQALSDWWASWTFPNIWQGLKDSFFETLQDLKRMWEDICEFFSNLNPFKNWSSEINVQARAESRKKLEQWDPLSGNLPGFATGGIIQRPSVIQVAEDGPEAIIPLQNKSRGIPLLMSAANSLGLRNFDVVKNNNSGDNSLENFSGSVYDNGRFPFLFSRSNDGSSVRNFNNWDVAPVININVSGNNNDDDNLAAKIAAAVRNAWDEIQSRQKRLSFA